MDWTKAVRTFDYDNVVMTYPCEYSNHGKWGQRTEPAAYLIDVECPYCGGCNVTLWVCHPCLTAKRLVGCPDCDGDMEPATAWTITARWF